jgi:hypothetical protein
MKVQQEEGSAGNDAPRLHPDDDERLRTCNAIIKTGSEWESRHDGAEAFEGLGVT